MFIHFDLTQILHHVEVMRLWKGQTSCALFMEFPCIKYTIWTDWHRFDLQILSSVRKYHTYCIYKYCSCAYLCTVHTFCQIHNVPPTFFPRDGGHNAAFIISHRERERERQWQTMYRIYLFRSIHHTSSAASSAGFAESGQEERQQQTKGGMGGFSGVTKWMPLEYNNKFIFIQTSIQHVLLLQRYMCQDTRENNAHYS